MNHPPTHDALLPTYDVVVIGGGPAGATAAQLIAARGHSVLLLDRGGRVKPCGGAIPPRLIRDFAIPDELLVAKARCARMVAPSKHRVDIPIENGFVLRYRADKGDMVSELGAYTINRFSAGQAAGYPTLCKGRFKVGEAEAYAFEDPVSLDVLEHLEALREAGVVALKIEGRQRSRAYVSTVTRVWREAIDALLRNAGGWREQPEWNATLSAHAEGHQTTLGPYHRSWH